MQGIDKPTSNGGSRITVKDLETVIIMNPGSQLSIHVCEVTVKMVAAGHQTVLLETNGDL